MKKLSKIMLSAAAAAVVTAAMAATAMAADTITGTYDNATGVVTMEGVVGSGASQTLLVFKNAAEEITSNDIAYINQIDNITNDSQNFSTFMLAAGLKPATAGESVKYNIKVGGTDGSVQTGTLTIAGDAPATVTIVIGDVTGDKEITSRDIQRIGRYITNAYVADKGTGDAGLTMTKPDGNVVVVGDVTGDNEITSRDIQRIGRYITNAYIADKGTGDAGVEVEVLKPASAE